MRIGIYGGSFNPIHFGHLILAEVCREVAQLDEVWFMPAAMSPHKQGVASIDGRQRLEMVQLAISGHPAFRASQLELDRGGVSYTVDTLRELKSQHPADQLFLMMGADSLRDFGTWREPQAICQLAQLLIVARGGMPPPGSQHLVELLGSETTRKIDEHVVPMPLVELSSRELRERVAQQLSIRYRVPRAVEQYIHQHQLYRSEGAPPQ